MTHYLKGSPSKIAKLSADTIKFRREWDNLFKLLQGKTLSTKNPISDKAAFKT